MTARHAFDLGRRCGRARARHGHPLPAPWAGWPGEVIVGMAFGWREVMTGRCV